MFKTSLSLISSPIPKTQNG